MFEAYPAIVVVQGSLDSLAFRALEKAVSELLATKILPMQSPAAMALMSEEDFVELTNFSRPLVIRLFYDGTADLQDRS